MMAFARVAACLSLCAALLSCGDITAGPNSTTVGAACTATSQCASQCLVDDTRFPGGFCTVECSRDADCPSGAVCISHMSGLCAVSCRVDADCAGFGRGFSCSDDTGILGNDVLICRAP
jgi:Cys-rich repeat protein